MITPIDLKTVVDLSPDGFWIVSNQGKLLQVNDKYLKMSGYTREEMLSFEIKNLDAEMSHTDLQKKIEEVKSGDDNPFKTSHKRKDGSIYQVEIHAKFNPQADVFIVFIRNIEHRKFYKAKSNIADEIFNSSVEGILVTDANNKIVIVNDSFCQITGYTKEEVIGKTPDILKSNRHSKHFYLRFWQTLTEEGKWAGEIWNKRKNGEVYPEWLTISSIRQNNQVVNYVAQFSDITEKKNSEEEKFFLAHHDHLTLLPNRSLLQDRLEMLIDLHHKTPISFALFFIDLDRFKIINDSLGHHIGDEILKVIAQRIKSELRAHDTIARVGGDEFVIIVEDCKDSKSVERIAKKILRLIEKPIEVHHGDFYLSGSVGVSLFPHHTDKLRELLSYADIAMYKAKGKGGNLFEVFDKDLEDKAHQRLEIESGIHKALDNNEFEIWYQPQVNVTNSKVYAAECLIRWRNPTLGVINPDLFIPIAEESGMIYKIGKFVLIEAINQIKEWSHKGVFSGTIAINISGKQLENDNFITDMENIINISKVSPSKIELEVTESAFDDSKTGNLEKLIKLREMGFTIAIDDFGTGYSSLKRIKTLPVDNLKIDKCFVDNITTSKEDEALVNTILNIANSFNMSLIAEGIETKEQCQKLLQMGVYNNQGYLHSKPLPAEEFEKFISTYSIKENEYHVY